MNEKGIITKKEGEILIINYNYYKIILKKIVIYCKDRY
jgi:hypothetical protein